VPVQNWTLSYLHGGYGHDNRWRVDGSFEQFYGVTIPESSHWSIKQKKDRVGSDTTFCRLYKKRFVLLLPAVSLLKKHHNGGLEVNSEKEGLRCKQQFSIAPGTSVLNP